MICLEARFHESDWIPAHHIGEDDLALLVLLPPPWSSGSWVSTTMLTVCIHIGVQIIKVI